MHSYFLFNPNKDIPGVPQVALVIKNQSGSGSLGWEDPLEESMATHFSILTWRLPWTEESGGYGPQDCKELDTPEAI